jgi:TolA-binding protein
MGKMKRGVAALLLLAVVQVFGFAQAAKSGEIGADMKKGLDLFRKSQFSEALSVFQNILLNPSLAAKQDDIQYWIALSYMGIKDYDNAERSVSQYLSSHGPAAPSYADALYQQARIYFLQGRFESAISVFNSFLSAYPNHDFYPSALFWSGECMYQLGHFEEAAKVFTALTQSYPGGVKTEAANYRLELIKLKYREEELLRLLKWSHEDSLKMVEEYKKREKTYEQAINIYQKQAGSDARTSDASQQELDGLRAQIATLKSDADAKAQRVADLESALAAQQVPGELSSQAERLYKLKIRLLSLKCGELEKQVAAGKEK